MHKIIKCHFCKKFAITSSKTTYKCINCKKSFLISKTKIYFESDNPKIVTLVLQKIKKEEFIQKKGNEFLDEFL